MYFCCGKDQTKDRFDVCIGTFVVAFAVHDFVDDVLSFDLNQPRTFGERDEVVAELAPVVFRVVDAQGHGYGCGHGVAVTVHGTGTVHHYQRVFPAGVVRQRLPRYVQRFAFIFICCLDVRFPAGGIVKHRRNDVVRGQAVRMHLRLAFFHVAQELLIPLPVVSLESRAVFVHGFGGKFRVVEVVFFYPQIVFQNVDAFAQCG